MSALQVWLLALVFLPARAAPSLRLSLCCLLAAITAASLPRQLARVSPGCALNWAGAT